MASYNLRSIGLSHLFLSLSISTIGHSTFDGSRRSDIANMTGMPKNIMKNKLNPIISINYSHLKTRVHTIVRFQNLMNLFYRRVNRPPLSTDQTEETYPNQIML